MKSMLDDNMPTIHGFQIDYGKTEVSGTMESSRVQYPGRPDLPKIHDVGMPVADEVVVPGMDRPIKSPIIVSVEKCDFSFLQFQRAEFTVAGVPRRFHGPAKIQVIVVVIAKHEMGRPSIKEGDDLRPADIPTMNHGSRQVLLEMLQCIERC